MTRALACIALLAALAAGLTLADRQKVNASQAWGARLLDEMEQVESDETSLNSAQATGQPDAELLADCRADATTYTRDATLHPADLPAGMPTQINPNEACK